MKTQIKMHKTVNICLLLIATVFLSSNVLAKGAELSKKVNKTFKVSKGQVLEIDNKFGEVNISSWDQQEVQLDIEIIVDQKNEDKAQKTLDRIEIEIKESSDLISISTSLGKDKNKSMNIDEKNKMEINYTVKMPATMKLDLENQFGNITIDKLTEMAKIEVQFGSAKIGSLSSAKNELTFKFSDPVIIDEIGGGEIELKFSKLDLGKAGDLNLNSQMSNSKIGDAKQSEMKVSYGSLDVESMKGLSMKSSMSTVKISELIDGGELDVQYGKLTIDKLRKEFKGLTIDSKFTPVTINVEEGAAFELDANTKMSKIHLPSGYEAKDESEYINNEYFKGVIGENGGSLPVMKISNQFGNIEIK